MVARLTIFVLECKLTQSAIGLLHVKDISWTLRLMMAGLELPRPRNPTYCATTV